MVLVHQNLLKNNEVYQFYYIFAVLTKKKIMKKLLLTFIAFAGINASAQTVLFEDDFNDSDISDWTLIDEDGDTFGWVPVNMTAAPIYMGMRSASWITSGPLTPDNWAISPAIDLGFGGTTVELSWKAVGRDPDWDLENYSVYVSDAPSTLGMLATTAVFTEILGGINVMTTRTVTLPSSLSGTVYVAFRHHDVSDQFTVDIDDVKVTSTLATDSFFASNYAVGPNPATDVVNISAKNNNTINTVEITDVNGRVVKNVTVNATTSQINVADLNSGVYFLKASSENGVGTSKIVKK